MKNVIILFTVLVFTSSFTVQQEYVVQKGYTVAFSKSSYDKMMDAVANNDKQYFQTLINSKEIMTLPNDIPVYLIENHVFAGYSEVRLKGKDVKLWTVNDALKKEN